MSSRLIVMLLASGRCSAMSRRLLCSGAGSDTDAASKTVKLKKKERNGKVSYPRIYTRTGDRGKTSLFTGERRIKSDQVFEALGSTDELSSHLGLAMEMATERSHDYVPLLQRIQCILQDVSSCIATPASSASAAHIAQAAFPSGLTVELEEWIDSYSKQLAPLQNFILPGGGKTSASLHVARAVCRRAERTVVPLVESGQVEPETLKYLNRLSDFLFTLARIAAKLDNEEETIYIRQKTPLQASYVESLKGGPWKRQQPGSEAGLSSE